MPVRVSLDDLQQAIEWVTGGGVGMDAAAYIHRETGEIHWLGDGVDEEWPKDIEVGTTYLAVPDKRELDLGQALVFKFVEECLPRSYDVVRGYFRKRGAYSRFKDLLDREGQLDAWYRYEQSAFEERLQRWCAENGLDLLRGAVRRDGK